MQVSLYIDLLRQFHTCCGFTNDLEIAANTQKCICVKINFLYSIPNNSYAITDISVLIFEQEISKCCFIKKCMYHWCHTTKTHQCDTSAHNVMPLNIRYSFPTCTFLRSGKPKSINEQHDGLWTGTINNQGLWDICLYRLTPRLTQSPTQQSYNWYSMERRHDTVTECWGKNVCTFMSKRPVQLHGVLLWYGNKLTFTFNKINTNSGGKPLESQFCEYIMGKFHLFPH